MSACAHVLVHLSMCECVQACMCVRVLCACLCMHTCVCCCLQIRLAVFTCIFPLIYKFLADPALVMYLQALAVVIAGLVGVGRLYGLGWLAKMYIVPYFVVNHWCVVI